MKTSDFSSAFSVLPNLLINLAEYEFCYGKRLAFQNLPMLLMLMLFSYHKKTTEFIVQFVALFQQIVKKIKKLISLF